MSDALPLSLSPAAARKAAPSSWMGALGLRILGRRGAQLGLVWVGVLVFFAVFAPFIASSFPYVWHEGGKTTYPLLAHLTPVDVALLLALLFAAGLAGFRRVPGRVGVFVWLVLASIPAVEWRVWWESASKPSMNGDLSRVAQMTPLFCALWGLAALALGAALVALAWRSRAPRWLKAGALAVALALGGFFAVCPVQPSEKYNHRHYREATKEGTGDGVFAPIPYSPSDLRSDITERRMAFNAPSAKAWFGTDGEGCDLASRMLHACRVALTIGLLSTAIALALGIMIGGLMGYFAGWVDMLGMRLVEIFSAIPVLPILIMICAFYERNIYLMMFILGLFGWVGYALFIRAEFLRLRTSDFVQAARAVGASTPRILIRHMLPSGVTPVLTLASFGVAGAIMMETTLSFLGLGLKPEDPSWGQPIQQLPDAGAEKWWLVVFPSAAIFLTVFSYNMIGEAMRDALDPKNNK